MLSTEPPRSERELLELRESQAKAALRVTTREAARNLLGLLDPRPAVQKHPWKSSGVAALAGFFVALKVVPGSDSKESAPAGAEPSAASEGPSPWATLTSTLVETGSGAVKAALLPWLAQKIQEWIPQKKKEEAEPKAEEVPFSP